MALQKQSISTLPGIVLEPMDVALQTSSGLLAAHGLERLRIPLIFFELVYVYRSPMSLHSFLASTASQDGPYEVHCIL
jgi:hypothetical protein